MPGWVSPSMRRPLPRLNHLAARRPLGPDFSRHGMKPVLFVCLFLLVISSAEARDATFSFAGFRVTDQIDQVSRRYPNSKRTANYIYVSETDARDHIYSILFDSHGDFARVRLNFEKKTVEPDGRNLRDYPSCRSVYERFSKDHGPQQANQRYHEEKTETHNRIWKAGRETAKLRCFRDSDGEWRVEAIEFIWSEGTGN